MRRTDLSPMHDKEMLLLRRILRVLSGAARRVLAGVAWLARQTYRQRSIGVATTPQLTRLLDLHAVTVAAHVALVAALLVSPGPAPRQWLFAGLVAGALTAAGIWRTSRIFLEVLILMQVAGLVVVAVWLPEPIGLAMLVALAVAQQGTLLAAWGRHGASWAALTRATAAGLLLGVFTGGGGFVVGIFTSGFPLWVSAVLLTVAAVLAARMPRPPRPELPRQTTTPPSGFTVYRPSSLD